MKDIFEPLSESEEEVLHDFLLDRMEYIEDEIPDGADEGILGISELDGFFTAIVSGPVPLQPSQWLNAVWGDFQVEWRDEDEFESIFFLMTRHMNAIASKLMYETDLFEPLFLQSEYDGEIVTIVDEWCAGYMRGVELASEEWKSGGKEIENLLMPIETFTSQEGWHRLKKMDYDEVVALQNRIPLSASSIHIFWLSCRGDEGEEASTFRHSGQRVGRNDPCPCGSGKKYKKCCLH